MVAFQILIGFLDRLTRSKKKVISQSDTSSPGDFHDSHADGINAASMCTAKTPDCAWGVLMMSFIFSSAVFDRKHVVHM